ncbi:MAG: hypothetical protein SPI59_02055 [Finegoldia sp.]|nr:hypothetical protein [Finegoldia sp.]
MSKYLLILTFILIKVLSDKLFDRLDRKKLSIFLMLCLFVGLFIYKVSDISLLNELILLILTSISIDDFMYMEVYWTDVIFLFIISLIDVIISGKIDLTSLIIPLLFICLAMFTSYMGIIDGLILLAIAMTLTYFDFLSLMLYISLVSGFIALLLILRGKRGEVSFVPFILIGYILQLGLGNFFEVIYEI